MTLLYGVIRFKILFGQKDTQWDGRLFTSYGEVIHVQMVILDYPTELLKQVNNQDVQLDAI